MRRLKDFFELMVINHCGAHKANLSIEDVVTKDPNYRKLETALKDVHNFYNYSKKQSKLKETCAILKIQF